MKGGEVPYGCIFCYYDSMFMLCGAILVLVVKKLLFGVKVPCIINCNVSKQRLRMYVSLTVVGESGC